MKTTRVIALIAPELQTFETARAVIKAQPGRIILALGVHERGVAETAKLARQGVEIVISRGETARMIAAAFPDLAVVTIKRSGFDIARAVTRALQRGKTIAAVSFPDSLARIAALCDALGLSVPVYPVADRTEAEDAVLRAAREGAEVIVGAASVVAAARRNSIPCELVQSGHASLTQAVEEALAIWQARQTDKARMSLLHAVLNATDEGIAAVDGNGLITVFNSEIERYSGYEAGNVIGTPISRIWPELNVRQALARDRGADPYALLRARDTTLVCTITPVTLDGAVCGAVCAFRDATRIQAMEASVRQRIHATGHVATVRFQDIRGDSPALRQAIAIAKDYARSDATVLLTGETGTGKELFAQSIHKHSARARGPFVAVNCAALPGQLLESELFGYVAGAFTGASSKGRPGLFELAHGGTIFLDEVTEMELAVQAKLLRVLQEKKIRPVGSDQIIPIDVRVIASTNKDAAKLASGGELRTDLYYRLNVLLLRLPPLRERKDDIPLLCRHFLGKSALPPAFSPGALRLLSSHHWPGNVRELQNVMDRIMATVNGPLVTENAVRLLLGYTENADSPAPPPARAEEIRLALSEAGGRRAQAAKRLGISRSTLWRAMRRLGLDSM